MPIGLPEASSILWRQRRLLELLLYKLEVEHMVLASGRPRWLARAADEVELVLDELRQTELARAVAIDEVADLLGLPPGCSLRELADAAPAPWGELFGEHRAAFLALAAEIGDLAALNRELASSGQRAIADSLARLAGTPTDHGYDLLHAGTGGRGRSGPSGPVLLDEAL